MAPVRPPPAELGRALLCETQAQLSPAEALSRTGAARPPPAGQQRQTRAARVRGQVAPAGSLALIWRADQWVYQQPAAAPPASGPSAASSAQSTQRGGLGADRPGCSTSSCSDYDDDHSLHTYIVVD
jgi:hypothetical protein